MAPSGVLAYLEFNFIAYWIQIHGFSLERLSSTNARLIGIKLGEVQAVDTTVDFEYTVVDYMRVKVALDIHNPQSPGFYFARLWIVCNGWRLSMKDFLVYLISVAKLILLVLMMKSFHIHSKWIWVLGPNMKINSIPSSGEVTHVDSVSVDLAKSLVDPSAPARLGSHIRLPIPSSKLAKGKQVLPLEDGGRSPVDSKDNLELEPHRDFCHSVKLPHCSSLSLDKAVYQN